MLSTITESALSILSCQLAWLLLYEDGILVTGAISSEGMDETFLQALGETYGEGIFIGEYGENPLAEVLLRNTPLVGLETARLDTIVGGTPLMSMLTSFELHYVALLPLRRDDRMLGVLVLGTQTDEIMNSEQGHQLIRVVRRQAVLELDLLEFEEQLNISLVQRQSEQNFYKVVLDTIGDGLVIANEAGQITYASQRLLMITGYRNRELLGQPVGMLFTNESRDMVMSHQYSNLSSVQTLQTKAGQVVPVLMSLVVARDLEDEGNSTVIVLSDLTDLRAHEQALQRQTQQLEALNKATRTINSPVAFEDVIQVILSSAREVVGAEAAVLLLRNSEDELVVIATEGREANKMHGRIVPKGIGIFGWVAENAEPLFVPDVNFDYRFRRGIDAYQEARSMAVVPLVASKEVIGVLAVLDRRGNIFDETNLETLGNLGTSAAIAIENATLFDQTQRRLTELSTLLDASAMVASTMDLPSTLQQISRRLREALDVHRVVISTISQRTQKLTRLVEVVDASWTEETSTAIALANAPGKSKALRQNQAALASITLIHPETADYLELRARGMRYALNVPLRFKNQIVGLMTFYGEEALGISHAATVEALIDDWQHDIESPWDHLTPLCYEALRQTQLRWCAVYRLQDQNLLLMREIGTESWANNNGPNWRLQDFGTIQRILESRESQSIIMYEGLEGIEATYCRYLGAAGYLTAPVTIQGQVSGVVQVMAIDRYRIDANAFSLAQGIANIVGNALENAALYSSLERRADALEAAYREVEEAGRMKDELLQNLSHELGTPLTHVLGYLSLLADEAFGPLNDEQRSTMEMVADKAQNLADLVKHMVSVHASTAENLNVKDTQLEQLAALAVRSLNPRAKAAGIKVVPRIQSNLPPVRVDQVAMGGVFEALIDNAIKFSKDGKLIEIAIGDPGGPMLQVTIRDEGIGIPSEEYDKIFRQFYQIDGSMTRHFGGMGLGLAIVQKVVQAHGGKVWVDSEVNKGTSIHFTVPKSTTDPSSSASNKSLFVFN